MTGPGYWVVFGNRLIWATRPNDISANENGKAANRKHWGHLGVAESSLSTTMV